MKSFEEINEWLEEKASKCDTKHWQEYYRGLKDFQLKESFGLSSADWKNPIAEYLSANKDLYKIDGFTGGCFVTKL